MSQAAPTAGGEAEASTRPVADPTARRTATVVTLTGIAAAVGIWLAWHLEGPPTDLVATAVLLVMLLASWMVRVEVLAKVSVGSTSIVQLAAFVLVGPFGAAVIAAVAMFAQKSRTMQARVFNAAMIAILGTVGSFTYLWVGGARDLTTLHGAGELLWWVGGPLMIANIVQNLVNLALVAAIVWASRGENFWRHFVAMLTTSGLAQTGYGVIGFLFVILWVPAEVGPLSALLILAPLFIARWAYLQYGDEQRAHERTLSALVAAAEARDQFAVGHSQRVADLAQQIGDELGMGPSIVALRYAAMLHDIGLIASLPGRRRTSAATGSGSDPLALLTDEQAAAIIAHPSSGVDLLSDIDFLQDSLPGIRHHHERLDGRGYPDRLAGSAIPLQARVIAVADAFDALTHDRPQRPALGAEAALALLIERGGRHLDPVVVGALARVLTRHPWASEQAADPAEQGATAAPVLSMHDDPLTSDALAELRDAMEAR